MYRGREAPMDWERPRDSHGNIQWLSAQPSTTQSPTSGPSSPSATDARSNSNRQGGGVNVASLSLFDRPVASTNSAGTPPVYAFGASNSNRPLAADTVATTPEIPTAVVNESRRKKALTTRRRNANNMRSSYGSDDEGEGWEEGDDDNLSLPRGRKRLRSSDHPKIESTGYDTSQHQGNGMAGWWSRAYGHVLLPHILTGWAYLFFCCCIMGIMLWLVAKVIFMVKHDLQLKSVEHATGKFVLCIRNLNQNNGNNFRYQTNNCGSGPVPYMAQVCTEWEVCMRRDPNDVRQLHVGAETMAHFLNHFMEPLSYKTMIFGTGSLLAIVITLFILSMIRTRFADSSHNSAHQPIPPQPVYSPMYNASRIPQPVFAPTYQFQPHLHPSSPDFHPGPYMTYPSHRASSMISPGGRESPMALEYSNNRVGGMVGAADSPRVAFRRRGGRHEDGDSD
ncbi:hypothetical protein SmJEL517_g01931 [Synchytrium microbalum]|uniref:Brl1/Brr6 domain-containing protein n=1 Tax=Synchytrium microbalum TaxID=1806994 RepID=A0A507C2L6_9FUNG|nr:uncharacterized protein SmJEL517_g01931 [Synchytrium microbalum]TPX35750.1 hypothetical protein SmJEL517_g01931 [Synchytrium microbalum]